MNLNHFSSFILTAILVCSFSCVNQTKETQINISKITATKNSPRIINIINFVRKTEPRISERTEDVLYQTVVEQIKQINEYNLKGTFLLQYDALVTPRYQELLKKESQNGSEIGAWWEITQPHVEDAGMKWRGRFSWDWHADVGFATGYSPDEREKLVDTYMEKFKSVFGYYPKSVGSWFIDAHTLGYMYDKYKIVASCNCKDQKGTDGYTLWGGYWNQGYYPSRKNSYMPAQNPDAQIPVPIFRMLGSDPIYQYDLGIGKPLQGVISLEPVYNEGGANKQWVDWYFRSVVDEPCLAYNYVQVGQENSFTWDIMKKGLEIQIPLVSELKKQQKIVVQTLCETGEWFRERYPVTPPTAITALTDILNKGNQTVWFNSRFYRANLLLNKSSFRFRDIHIFDEKFASDYLHKAGNSNQCIYTTLPIVDGYSWSTVDTLAGLRFYKTNKNKSKEEITLDNLLVTELSDNTLQVECKTVEGAIFHIIFYEDRFEINCQFSGKDFAWVMELHTTPGANLPFTSIEKNSIRASLKNFNYSVRCTTGSIEAPNKNSDFVFRLVPKRNKLVISCVNNQG